MSKVLVLGGTGAMGVYLVPELLKQRHEVYVTSRSYRTSTDEKLHYIQGDAKNDVFMSGIINDNYDAIVDFMIYSTEEFISKYERLLENTKHYIYISSYRVFAESKSPLTETSPQLIDVSDDIDYLKTDEYALAKARQERILRNSKWNNWTILRPAITYSKNRFQLGTLEANVFVFRSLQKCPVILPREMLSKKTTMTWAGDVAAMIAKVVANQQTYREDYNICTSEYHTWDEVVKYYETFIGLNVIQISLDKYIKIIGGKAQILYDRMYDRVLDNSKIINLTNIKKKNLKPLEIGLEEELIYFCKYNNAIIPDYKINAKIDRITNTHIPLLNASKKDKVLYYMTYTGADIVLLYLKNMIRKLT